MSDYFARDGSRMTLDQWVAKFGDEAYQRVDADEVGEVRISTVWLGLNHSYGAGPPLIFETMIFGGEHDQDQWRYSTEDEAREGHARAVALVKGDGE